MKHGRSVLVGAVLLALAGNGAHAMEPAASVTVLVRADATRNVASAASASRVKALGTAVAPVASGEEARALARHRLDRYYTIPTRHLDARELARFVDELRAEPAVEDVFPEPVAEPAFDRGDRWLANTPDYLNMQNYLGNPAPMVPYRVGGVNARAVWSRPGGRGEHARVVSVEVDHWSYEHEDLPRPFLQHWNVETHVTGAHDTKSAGVIASLDNGYGTTGIAHQAALGYSRYGSDAQLVDLAQHLKPGDVVQIGVHLRFAELDAVMGCGQRCWMPVDYRAPIFDAISYLTQEKGVHVVIAAANGSIDLDHPHFDGWFDREKRDSGAIYVASIDPVSGSRRASSQHGRRIDTHAWGSNVTTTSWSADVPTDLYTHEFNGTSSANPIIAGSAAVVQSLAFARGMGAIPPKTLRRWLVGSGYPPPVADPGKPIGVQPDLARVTFD